MATTSASKSRKQIKELRHCMVFVLLSECIAASSLIYFHTPKLICDFHHFATYARLAIMMTPPVDEMHLHIFQASSFQALCQSPSRDWPTDVICATIDDPNLHILAQLV